MRGSKARIDSMEWAESAKDPACRSKRRSQVLASWPKPVENDNIY